MQSLDEQYREAAYQLSWLRSALAALHGDTAKILDEQRNLEYRIVIANGIFNNVVAKMNVRTYKGDYTPQAIIVEDSGEE